MPKPICKLVAYFRVSTDKQGQSGLGMEAQQALVESFRLSTGCEVIASYTEVESGKRNDRPELKRALAHAKRAKATLVIAKLDRLGRNVHFISGLMETGVEFKAADSPNDDRFVLHIKAAVAEDEARKISDRTKAALAALKARGVTLGTPANLTHAARLKGSIAGVASKRAKAVEAYSDAVPIIARLRDEGRSQRAIADQLNSEGFTTRTGKPWNQVQVMRVLSRMGS